MKKRRRLKKGPIIALIILLIALIGVFIILGNNNSNKGKKKTTTSVEQPKKIDVETPKDKRLKIVMAGDSLIHETVYLDALKEDGTYDFSNMFTYIKSMIQNYDLRYVNQESTIGGKNLGISAYPSFNSPDEIGNNLVDLGFNMVSLANNHSLDRGSKAVLYSNEYWKKKGVITAGTYSNESERNETKIYEKNGIKYAFLSYTTSSNNAVPNNYIINMYSSDLATKDVEAAKSAGAEVIIVAMHWGTEYTNEETLSQQSIAEHLSSLGVNLIIGTHPHVVEPITYVGDTLVIYSLGNLISNQLVLGVNQGTGMLVGVDIVVTPNGDVKFENLNYELLLSYSDNSTNFKVIPYSKLTEKELTNYESYKTKYESVVERYMEI